MDNGSGRTSEVVGDYKGEESYWSLTIDGSTRPEFVWTYRWPHAESQKVAGLACFYNERVDIYVDGELGTPQDEVQLSRSTSYQLTVTTSSR